MQHTAVPATHMAVSRRPRQDENLFGIGINSAGRSPGFSFPFKCPSEHLNELENPTTSNELSATRESITAPGWLNHYNNPTNIKATKLTTDKKIGPNAFFKVMAGDKLVMSTDYYYATGGTSTSGGATNAIVSSLISALTGSPAATGGVKDAGTQIQAQLTAPGNFANFLENPANVVSTPNANLVYLFFDENFNPIMYDAGTGLGSGAKPVGPSAANTDPSIPAFTATVPANGYAFVYLSNNSPIEVWFDNFVVSHQRGRILQENHYYPYGLQIASISSKAAGKMDNMYRYQGAYSEFEEETGWTDFELRMYDAQIGRWTGVDPYDQFVSPYIGMGNYPVGSTDPDGGASGVDNFIVAPGHFNALKYAANRAFYESLTTKLIKGASYLYNYSVVNLNGFKETFTSSTFLGSATSYNGQQFSSDGISYEYHTEDVSTLLDNRAYDPPPLSDFIAKNNADFSKRITFVPIGRKNGNITVYRNGRGEIKEVAHPQRQKW